MVCSSVDEAGPDPSTWQGRLYAALQGVEAPGQFATSAVYTQDLTAKPLVTVQGAGPVSIPVSKEQATALLTAGEWTLVEVLWSLACRSHALQGFLTLTCRHSLNLHFRNWHGTNICPGLLLCDFHLQVSLRPMARVWQQCMMRM
jgi:hypothetical protein